MRFLLIALLSLGLFFRLANLDHKLYWYDETFTSLRASGYTEAEVVQNFAASSITSVAELQKFQHPAANRGLTDTLHSLALEDNQHPPLYYAIASFWSRWIGSSVAAYRLLPALCSLLGLPAMYWVCQELFVKMGRFSSTLPCWVGVGLFAISPFQVIYAQESRQYSLWSTTTLLMTAALLRALRIQTRFSWALYALTVTASFYTFLLSSLVTVAHGIYVLFQSKLQPQRTWLAYLLATLIAAIAFLPWGWILMHNVSQAQSVTSWTTYQQPLFQLVLTWISIIGQIFYDRGETLIDRLIQIGLLSLVGYAFYCVCRQSTRPIWLLVVTLTVVPVLPLVLGDVLVGGIRSTFPRYFIPSLLGIQLAVVYLLSAKLSSGQLHNRWRWVAASVCCAGVVSCLTSFQATTWWHKTLNSENPAIAEIIQRSPQPLLVSDAETGDIMALSYALKPDVAMLIRPRCYTCSPKADPFFDSSFVQIPDSYSDVFLYHSRGPYLWEQSLENNQKFRFELIPLEGQRKNNKVLWRIMNK